MVHVHVSRSSSMPEGLPPDLLVAEQGSASPPWLPRMEVPAAGDPRAWVPLAWVRTAACALRERMGLPLWRPAPPRLPAMAKAGLVILTDHSSDALQSLLVSVRAKAPELSLDAAACSELGHGLHAQLVAGGGTLVRIGGPLPAEVEDWLKNHAPHVRIVEMPGPADPLAALAATALFLEMLAETAGLDLVSPRLPEAADRLRHVRPTVPFAEVA